MAIALALASALTYGAADFFGGFVTRRVPAIAVVLLSQLLGAVPMLVLLLLIPAERVTASDVWWGVAAGGAGATGVLLLYRALSVGRMSVVAPITAIEAASIPVVFGLVSGERPTPLALTGVIIALPAVALISSEAGSGAEEPPPASRGRPEIPEALGAGLAFGVFFILLSKAGGDSGLWPLAGARTSALLLVGTLAALTSTSLRVPAGTLRTIAAAGALDVAANVLFLLATREGLLALVAVLTSMYPASTVLLARVVLGERWSRLQAGGLAAATVAVTLISIG
jgi:drug/metabolite transporter (DMT)-like permease